MVGPYRKTSWTPFRNFTLLVPTIQRIKGQRYPSILGLNWLIICIYQISVTLGGGVVRYPEKVIEWSHEFVRDLKTKSPQRKSDRGDNVIRIYSEGTNRINRSRKKETVNFFLLGRQNGIHPHLFSVGKVLLYRKFKVGFSIRLRYSSYYFLMEFVSLVTRGIGPPTFPERYKFSGPTDCTLTSLSYSDRVSVPVQYDGEHPVPTCKYKIIFTLPFGSVSELVFFFFFF